MKRNRRQLIAFTIKPALLAPLLASAPVVVSAAEWSNSYGLRVGQVYTDNVRLTPVDEESDTYSIITPTFGISGNGARASVELDGSLQYNTQGGDGDDFNPELRAGAKAELVQSWLFVDLDASARQTAIDPFAADARTSLSNSLNSTTTYQYGISPYISSRLGNFASYLLRYRIDEQESEDSDSNTASINDSSNESAAFNLSSGPKFGRFSWGLSANYSSSSYDGRGGNAFATDDSDNEFRSANARIGYRLNRKWKLEASGGKEWNDFQSVNDDVDGNSWHASAVWTPNKRTSVNFGYGERFFGSTPYLEVDYEHKRSNFRVRWERDVTDSRSIRQRDDVLDVIGLPEDSLIRLSDGLTTPQNSTIIERRLEYAYYLSGKRTSLSLSGKRSEQERQDTGNEDIFSSHTVSLERSLSSQSTVNVSYTFDERESGGLERTFESDFASISFSRTLSHSMTLSLNYNYSERDSDIERDNYRENRVTLFLSTSF